jgi:predicted phage terminase large subunit-like protein
MAKYQKKAVEEWLRETDYRFIGYMPKATALLFVNFIKEVNTGSEENETPLVHLKMMDRVFNKDKRCAILCHRGIGKTTVFAEYLFLFIAAFGIFPGFGNVNLCLYVTDSIENGVKNLRRNVEYRYGNSDFLQRLIPNRRITVGTNGAGYVGMNQYESDISAGRKFTDIRLEFKNNKGHILIVKGYGAKTGVRGAKELGQRPTIAILDDLVSDTDAESPTVIKTIENTVYKAVSKALHPTHQKMVWLGTPFNARDPLYKAVESGAWRTSVYPICEHYPCEKKDFRGSWEDRFPFEYIKDEYEEAQAVGAPENFNQELMLRIMSDEERLIEDSEIQWYAHRDVVSRRAAYNCYITTDFAVSEKEANDFSVISVWLYNNKGFWYWVDGICKKQLMDKNFDDLFRLAQKWNPLSVGIEVSGQQQGFIVLIQKDMIVRNIFFNLASDNNGSLMGIRPNINKMVRFSTIVPWFKNNMMFFPSELKESIAMKECVDELSLASKAGLKSKHDDFIDTISMLGVLVTWRPSESINIIKNKLTDIWEIESNDDNYGDSLQSYIV